MIEDLRLFRNSATAGADAPGPAGHCNFAFQASWHEPFVYAGEL